MFFEVHRFKNNHLSTSQSSVRLLYTAQNRSRMELDGLPNGVHQDGVKQEPKSKTGRKHKRFLFKEKVNGNPLHRKRRHLSEVVIVSGYFPLIYVG